MAEKLTGEQFLGVVQSICRALNKNDSETVLLVTKGLANAQNNKANAETTFNTLEVQDKVVEAKSKNYQGSAPIPSNSVSKYSNGTSSKHTHTHTSNHKSFKAIVEHGASEVAPTTPKESETKVKST